jgi:hypothetical protein
VVDVSDTSKFSDRFISVRKLGAMRKALPTKFRSLADAFYLPDDLAVDYELTYQTSQNQVRLD